MVIGRIGRSELALFVLLALGAWLCAPAHALAHVPVLEPRAPSEAALTDEGVRGAREIEPPTESRAVYGTLSPGERLDAYSFTAATDIETTVELLVPAADTTGRDGADWQLVIANPDNDNAARSGVAAEETFFEPFSIQRFRVVSRISYRFEADSTYFITVRHRGDDPPVRPLPYVVGFSGAERFTARDWVSSAAYVPRIWFGLYGQWAPRWGMIAGAGLLLGAAVFFTTRALRRGRRTRRSLSRSSTVE